MLDVTYYSQPNQSRCHQEPCVYLGAGCPGMEVKKWPPNGGSRPVGWRATQTHLVRKLIVSPFFVQWTGELISMAFCVYVAYLDKHSEKLISSLLHVIVLTLVLVQFFIVKLFLRFIDNLSVPDIPDFCDFMYLDKGCWWWYILYTLNRYLNFIVLLMASLAIILI